MLYKKLIRPLLFRVRPERIHDVMMALLPHAPLRALLRAPKAAVERPCTLWNLTFRNPLGLAAGFDKNGVALPAWRALGFGFVEMGTVTRHPQPGNPRPRIFRCVEARGLINRMGFPNDGAVRVAERVKRIRQKHAFERFPVGINIGKSKITPLEEAKEDYLFTYETLYPHGDFFVVNVSSPNTPGLRELQHPDQLRPILSALQAFNQAQQKEKPLLVKIAPDLTEEQIGEIVALALDMRLDGIVATNTTIDHSSVNLDEKGGLSGKPLRERSTEVIRLIRDKTDGQLPIIGAGGIFSRDDLLEKRDAGATLFETYTGFVYEGPRMVTRVLRD